MTDPFLAHVRFSDHVARCHECHAPFTTCATGRELLATWQRAEELATKQAEEADRAAHIEACPDATGYSEDCAEEGEFYREARRESFE